MARSIINYTIKIAALAIAAFAAFAYWERKDNGRYIYHELLETEHAKGSIVVLDTRTGIIFTITNDGVGEIDLKTGKVTTRKPN